VPASVRTRIVAARAPSSCGEKRIRILHCPPLSSGAQQVVEPTKKSSSPGSLSTFVKNSGPRTIWVPPSFVSVKTFDALTVPTGVSPNVALVGEMLTSACAAGARASAARVP
jgi:hypothetical protein